jgi:hypothetical protein
MFLLPVQMSMLRYVGLPALECLDQLLIFSNFDCVSVSGVERNARLTLTDQAVAVWALANRRRNHGRTGFIIKKHKLEFSSDIDTQVARLPTRGACVLSTGAFLKLRLRLRFL